MGRISADKIREIEEKVKHEFPSCRVLQEIHFYRYIKEIEWKDKKAKEIIEDIRKGAEAVKKEMEGE